VSQATGNTDFCKTTHSAQHSTSNTQPLSYSWQLTMNWQYKMIITMVPRQHSTANTKWYHDPSTTCNFHYKTMSWSLDTIQLPVQNDIMILDSTQIGIQIVIMILDNIQFGIQNDIMILDNIQLEYKTISWFSQNQPYKTFSIRRGPRIPSWYYHVTSTRFNSAGAKTYN